MTATPTAGATAPVAAPDPVAAPLVRVVLPAMLRETAGRRDVSVRAGSVSAALGELCRAEPLLGRRICDETGALRPHLLLFVGDSDVRALDGLSTALTDGAELHVLTAVSGG